MMGIPLYLFYFIYLALIVVFIFYSLFNIYHLVRFGFLGIVSIVIIFFYIGISIAILLLTASFANQVDWQVVIPMSFTLETAY